MTTETIGARLLAIIYARVSTRAQAEGGFSLRQQVEALRRWCEAEGYEVLEVVEDAGYSGASFERPGLDRVRDLVAEGNVSVVVAQDRDRFAREPAYLYLLRREFEEHGTKIRALNDRGDDSPEGELTDGILDQLAKFERAKTRERSRRGKNRKVAEGKIVAGPRPPFGFAYSEDGGSLVVDGARMRVLRRMLSWLALEGLSLGEVVRRLADEGAPAPSGPDAPWHKTAVRRLALTDLYRPHTRDEVAALVSPEVAASLDDGRSYGLWRWNEHVVPVALGDAAPPRAVVDAARERIAQNGGRRPPSAIAGRLWQLAGGVVFCGECGGALSPRARSRKSGKTDLWYTCRQGYSSRTRHCTHTTCYRAAELEEAVWGGVFGLISDPGRLRRQHDRHVERMRREMRGDPGREARDLTDALEKLERRRSGFLDLAADGDMSRELLRLKLAELEEKRGGLERALREARERGRTVEEAERAFAAARQMLQLVPLTYATASPGDRRRMYEALRLQAHVEKGGAIRLSGVFEPDVWLQDLLQDPPIDPSEPVPRPPEGMGVVATPFPQQ